MILYLLFSLFLLKLTWGGSMYQGRWRTTFKDYCHSDVIGVQFSSVDMTGKCATIPFGPHPWARSQCLSEDSMVSMCVFHNSMCFGEPQRWDNHTFDYPDCVATPYYTNVIDTCDLSAETEQYLEKNNTALIRFYDRYFLNGQCSFKRNFAYWTKNKCAMMDDLHSNNASVIKCEKNEDGDVVLKHTLFEKCSEDGNGVGEIQTNTYKVGECVTIPGTDPPVDLIVERCPVTPRVDGRWRLHFSDSQCVHGIRGAIRSEVDMSGVCSETPKFPRRSDDYNVVMEWSKTTCAESPITGFDVFRSIYNDENCVTFQDWDNATFEYEECTQTPSLLSVVDKCNLSDPVARFFDLNSTVLVNYFNEATCQEENKRNYAFWVKNKCAMMSEIEQSHFSEMTCEINPTGEKIMKHTTFEKCLDSGEGEGLIVTNEYEIGQCFEVPMSNPKLYILVERCPITPSINGKWRLHYVDAKCEKEIAGVLFSEVDMTGKCIQSSEFPIQNELSWTKTICVDHGENKVVREIFSDQNCQTIKKWNNASFEHETCDRTAYQLSVLDVCSLPEDVEKFLAENSTILISYYEPVEGKLEEPICTEENKITFSHWIEDYCAFMVDLTGDHSTLTCRGSSFGAAIMIQSNFEECLESGKGKKEIGSLEYVVGECVKIPGSDPPRNMLVERCKVPPKPIPPKYSGGEVALILFFVCFIPFLCIAAFIGVIFFVWYFSIKYSKRKRRRRKGYQEIKEETITEFKSLDIVRSNNMYKEANVQTENVQVNLLSSTSQYICNSTEK